MSREYAGLFLRLGLAFLFFYFGIDKFLNPEINTASLENLWLVSAMPLSASTQVVIAGVAELAIGILLVLGAYNTYTSLAAAAWTFLIFVQLGFSGGAYDLALSAVAISLHFTGPGKLSIKP